MLRQKQKGLVMVISEIRRRNLQQARQSYNTLNEFAEKINSPPNVLSEQLSGKRAIGDSIARRVEVALGLELGWMDVLQLNDAQKSYHERVLAERRVPMMPWENTGNIYEFFKGYWQDGGDDVSAGGIKGRIGQYAFAFRITMNENTPDFEINDLVIVDDSIEPQPGDMISVFIEPFNRPFFRMFRPNAPRPNLDSKTPFVPLNYDLVPINTNFPTITITPNYPGIYLGTMIEHRSYRRGMPLPV